jgi:Tol biopolymer transport system component
LALAFTACPAAAQSPQLLIAFSSYRERPQHPQIYFYEHDGLATGKIAGNIPTAGKRSDNRASLSVDGRICAFAAEVENETSRIFVWDRTDQKLLETPTLNDSPNAQLWPTLSGDGKFVAFAAWNRPGATLRWDLFLYDLAAKQVSALAEINTPAGDERMPAFSRDGRLLAFTTNSPDGAGLSDIQIIDWRRAEPQSLAGLNTPHREVEPSLSADGRWLAFVSDRPGGVGGRDVYLFDCQERKLTPLAGLNSVAHEQTPSLSPDGRYIAFVSERIRGEGERDIFLYDRQAQKLLETPGLNARQEDIDPCVIVLPAPK